MDSPPFVVVEVPLNEEDPLMPSRVMFYRPGDWTNDLLKAHRFDEVKAARTQAAKVMHYAKNVYAAPVPFPLAWALINGTKVSWDKHTGVRS